MKIIIVGGGKQGFQLAKYIYQSGHQVTVIESDPTKVERLNEKLNVKVVLGDGTKEEILEKAGIEETDTIIAVTSCDQDNLVVCQLAERKFDVDKSLTLVNNPGNEKLFEWLGVNQVISSTATILNLINNDQDFKKPKELWADCINDLKMHYIQITDSSPVINKKVTNINLPDEAILITVLRDDDAIVPRGNTRIKAEDTVIALADAEHKSKLFAVMTGQNQTVAS